MKNPHIHLWQIDSIRGVAIVGMVIYHLLFDLEFLFGLPISATGPPLVLLARAVATLFILLVGVSATIKFERIKSGGTISVLKSFVKKATILSAYAMIITLITYFIFPKSFIIFGILHFIAVSLILLVPFLYLRSSILMMLSFLFLSSGYFIQNIKYITNLFFPFGITSYTFSSLDYFPLLPWFGVVLIGIILARKYIIHHQGYLQNQKIPNKLVSLLVLSGQHSLTIYLVHQPVLFAILLIIKRII